jgi:heme-degrading monooxygenase HmoA
VAILVYLRFELAATANLRDFEGDLRAMAVRAEDQRGYIWSEMGPSLGDASVYIVVSAWKTIDDVRTWEHEPVHEEIQHKWEPYFLKPLVHERWMPWIRPETDQAT